LLHRLPGLFLNPIRLYEQSALRASTAAFSGLRSGLTLSKVQSTASKLARKQPAFLQVIIHEFFEFVNNQGYASTSSSGADSFSGTIK
jgi:hypothetical protein